MNLGRKLTIDWPCAVGDWLWLYVIMATVAFLDRLTLRLVLRVALRLAVFALLLLYFQQIMALDLTFLFYIDVAAYPDIIAAVFVLVAGGFAGKMLGAAAHAVRPALRQCKMMLQRFGARQRRNANALRRKGHADKQSDDEPAAWIGGAYACA